MEIFFENQYLPDRKVYKEYIYKILYRNLYLCSLILIPISAVMIVFTILQKDYTFATLFAVCGIIILNVMLLACPMTLKQLINQYNRLHNGKKPKSIFRFSDEIKISEGAVSLSISYEQITDAKELRYSYVLLFGKRNAVILKKDAFTIGSLPELKVFLKERCPNLSAS